jgi:P-type E1-E2 ATPase
VNHRKVKVFDYSNKTFSDRLWQEIEVGDFIKVHKDEAFPCDLLFVKSAAVNGIAFVDTMNLDGEVSPILDF